MPSDRTGQALLDIRDNVRLAQQFIDGMTLETFKADRRTFHAVARCPEIISEAARHSLDPLIGVVESEIASDGQ
jgi:uncharacterized protein with HEPN domain